MDYRRNFQPGGTFFFTVVTYHRLPIFAHEDAVDCLQKIIRQVKNERPFQILAWVIVPDHLHMIWKLPQGDSDFSQRWSKIKSMFTRQWLAMDGLEGVQSYGQKNDRRRAVWQNRFLEHTIRDEDDFSNHMDYIHFNPVKHGYCDVPTAWRWSSLHTYVERGVYPVHWCMTEQDHKSIQSKLEHICFE